MTRTILVIDTDSGFPARFRSKLVDEEIADQYEVETLTPNTTLHPAALVDDCVEKTLNILATKDIACIFIDIVVYESGGSPIDHTGSTLAKKLRSLLPHLSIFNITGKYIDIEQADILSEATIEDVDGVFIKTFLDGKSFSESRLKKILGKAAAKRTRYQPIESKLAPPLIPAAATKSFSAANLEARIQSQIQEIGEIEFWSLLLNLLPGAEGTLSYMKPGRSGAYVFRVHSKFRNEEHSITRPKSWIVKIAREKELLEAELKNYHEMIHTPLPRAFYPKTLQSTPVVMGRFAGFALELEDNASTLMERFEELPDEAVEMVVGGIEKFIHDTYGEASNKITKTWQEFYTLNDALKATILSFFEESEKILKQVGDRRWKNVQAFIMTNGEINSAVYRLEGEVDRRKIHGDFNARNILVKDKGDIVLIDFASRRLDHVAKDIAKLERDIILRVFDGQSANYYDWSRNKIWDGFSKMVKPGNVFSSEREDIYDGGIKKSVGFIYSLRKSLKLASPSLREEDYLCSLLHYFLLSLAHPEISIQKKVFAIKFIADILDSLSKDKAYPPA